MIESGTLLQNRYRVVKQIGQGGMGVVYLATDERFGSTVAVKQTFFDDPALSKAFEREAHLLNHLRHTALPKVSDHFTESDGQFLVMELIEGADISDLLQQRNGAFPLADVLRWADELLDALDYLHTHEPPVVHRDIKPQNLKLTSRGQIVLLDFGLAKGTSTQTRANVTAAAASVFGYSRNYAPLEQIQGTGTDARSDLYSLGATLYHLLTGMPPVDALTRASAIINGQPDPLRPAHLAHAQVPPAVSEILRRSMAQNAAHRQPTAADMRATLRRAANALSEQGASVTAHNGSATDVATVVEPMPQATYGQQPYTYARPMMQLQRPPAASKGETTIVESHTTRRRPSTTFIMPPDTPPARKSSTMYVGVAIAVLVACALIAFPLMRRSSDALPANSGAQSGTPSGAPANAETATPDATQPQAPGETQNSSSTFETTTSQAQSNVARPAAAASQTATGGQYANGNPEATSVNNTGAGEANRTSAAAPAAVSSADSSGLVIQSPAPNSQPSNKSAAAEYDAQRAEDLRRRKQQQEQQLQQQREREQQPQYGPPPPHMGGGQRPPPRRPPPY